MVQDGGKLPEVPAEDEQWDVAKRMHGGLEGRVLAPTVVEDVVSTLSEVTIHDLTPHGRIVSRKRQEFPVEGLKSEEMLI